MKSYLASQLRINNFQVVTHTISSLTKQAQQSGLNKREAEMLIAHVLKMSRASVIAHPEYMLDAAQVTLAQSLFARRAAGEPIAYLIETREFYGREFGVNEHVLIPRPETEILLEQALARLNNEKWPESHAGSGPSKSDHRAQRVLDLGTGSGIIAITLKLEHPACEVTACDISPGALNVARENAKKWDANIHFLESDWFTAFSSQAFDLIVSNPPYVAHNDVHLKQGDLRFEPALALTDQTPGAAGLACIAHLIEQAPHYLSPGGWLLFEHGYGQAATCRDLLIARGFQSLISLHDLAAIPRVAGGRWL